MKVSAIHFEDYLKCPTKCFLRSQGEAELENSYAGWVRSQNELHRTNGIRRLTDKVNCSECALGPPIGNINRAAWRLAIDLAVAGEHLESTIHSVERIPSERRGASAQLIPTRFVFTNRLNRDDKLLLAFDALTLSEATGAKVNVGKIVHGDDHVTSKVNTAALAGKLGKLISEITMLVSTKSPPDLILNRHCAECEFQSRCRQKAIEKDDLSLLSNMTAKERKKLHSKGIFTVTQLSYTFRPRRRPRRLRNKREKYHHALKALAIQKGKIHIVGDPQLKIEGTPVYLDVEALPGRDLYYLIGVRIGSGASAVQHSLWADGVRDEGRIWRELLGILETVEMPVLIHYGSYETTFLKRMSERHGAPLDDSAPAKAIRSALNLVSFLFSRVYFPTYSNTLKDIGAWLGCKWSAAASSGAQSIIWRMDWERSSDPSLKRNLVNYNMEDCHALEVLTRTLLRLCGPDQRLSSEGVADPGVEFADNSRSREFLWRQFSSPIAEFEIINKAARWDYQRDRVYVRTDTLLKRATSIRRVRIPRVAQINKDINCPDLQACPVCGRKPDKLFRKRPRVLYDIRFNRFGLARWVVKFHFRYYWCALCNERFGMPEEFWPGSQYGRKLVALIVYETIGQCVPQLTEKDRLNRLFGFSLGTSTVHDLKASAAEYYAETREKILARMVKGKLIHADETPIGLKGGGGYVWVFATFREVVYFYAETRQGDLLRDRLKGFGGVLVSDFYPAYESLPCPQQKCLLHVMRDLNEAVLEYPYDEELKQIVAGFADLMKSIVQTIDHRGLKRRFLSKHVAGVSRFYREMSKITYNTEVSRKWRDRFEKNRDKLFTFLTYDGVPWNNNNAEHAIKAFARLRRLIVGLSSPKGIEEYLILLSVCQTCRYSGVDFLDFLRSGQKDINAFAGFKGTIDVYTGIV